MKYFLAWVLALSFSNVSGMSPAEETPPPLSPAPESMADVPAPPGSIVAYGRGERIDIYWSEPEDWHNNENVHFELHARGQDDTAFKRVHEGYLDLPAFSDFRAAGEIVAYKVRSVELGEEGEELQSSGWSDTFTAMAASYEADQLLDEVQEANFRYFWNYRHPVSGLPREGTGGWNRNMCSVAATGMMFFNIAVGMENAWITRDEGLGLVEKSLLFLTEKADRFHGVFPHWLHGVTGKTIPFSDKDDGADLVETSFLIFGALFFDAYLREDPSDQANAIRGMIDRLWREVQWNFFIKERPDGRKPLLWHWSPNYGFEIDLEVVGFSECQVTYLLAMASPTHPVSPDSYFNGWMDDGYGRERLHYDLSLTLGREQYAPPLFFTHYSYLGLDPRRVNYAGKSYFDHFRDFCRVHIEWAREHRRELEGTGIWGMTAGLHPDGYGVHHPGHDHGTMSPTAFLASMPYAPVEAIKSMQSMYTLYRDKFWGPFGFYDAMNVERNWFSHQYIAIDVGPIAPMIENYKTGFCWNVMADHSELNRVIAIVNDK